MDILNIFWVIERILVGKFCGANRGEDVWTSADLEAGKIVARCIRYRPGSRLSHEGAPPQRVDRLCD